MGLLTLWGNKDYLSAAIQVCLGTKGLLRISALTFPPTYSLRRYLHQNWLGASAQSHSPSIGIARMSLLMGHTVCVQGTYEWVDGKL